MENFTKIYESIYQEDLGHKIGNAVNRVVNSITNKASSLVNVSDSNDWDVSLQNIAKTITKSEKKGNLLSPATEKILKTNNIYNLKNYSQLYQALKQIESGKGKKAILNIANSLLKQEEFKDNKDLANLKATYARMAQAGKRSGQDVNNLHGNSGAQNGTTPTGQNTSGSASNSSQLLSQFNQVLNNNGNNTGNTAAQQSTPSNASNDGSNSSSSASSNTNAISKDQIRKVADWFEQNGNWTGNKADNDKAVATALKSAGFNIAESKLIDHFLNKYYF